MSALVEYDATELAYCTPGERTGHLVGVSVYPDGREEQGLLLRVPHRNYREDVVQAVAALHQQRQGIDTNRGEWEYDWGSVERARSGIWRPEPNGLPVEHAEVEEVFSVGEPPLGATRGRRDSSEDRRWVYVATADQAKPTSPLKRLLAMHNELSRPSIGANSWGRINYQVRSSNTLFLRLTPGTPRAAVLVDTDPNAETPCHLRIDLVMLVNWLSARLRET